MLISYSQEQLKRAQRNGARKKNGAPAVRCPECSGKSFTPRQRQPQFIACNNCKTITTITEAQQHAQLLNVKKLAKPKLESLPTNAPERHRYEYKWKPLKRDPMAHMALAMLTRR